MARFLTPAKIGLLTLLELYAEGVVPAPATIPVLAFVLEQILPSAGDATTHVAGGGHLPYLTDINAFEKLLSPHPASAGHPGRNLWDRLLAKLWRIDSLDALHDFFARCGALLVKTHDETKRDAEMGIPPPPAEVILLSRTSPCGTFVRRALIEFERLPFSEAIQLWSTFLRWRRDTKAYWTRRTGHPGRWAGDGVLGEGVTGWSADETETLELIAYGLPQSDTGVAGRSSTDDVEKLLEFQVDQMQKLGVRVPVEIKDRFKDALDESMVKPSLSHYLSFLDAWKSGDHPRSFDYLHRYFDYTMQNRDRLFYQYALMNLAVLQADFGCFGEAVTAMLETVTTARENKDMPCLNFALNWLYHFGKAHPTIIDETNSANMTGIEREGLQYLRVKSKDTGMFTLWSSTLLSEAKLSMTNGESMATTFETLLKSSQLITDKNMKSMMGPQMAMYSSIWGRLGVAQLARQYCQIFLASYAQSALFDDTLRFTCRLALSLTERGRYEEGLDLLAGLDTNALRSWKANQYWLRYRGILRTRRALHRNDLDEAHRLLSQLLQGIGEDCDMDMSFEIHMLDIDYLMRLSSFDQAHARISSLFGLLKETKDDINLRIRLLIAKATLLRRVDRPQRAFSISVRAANIAWRARLLPSLWHAMGMIANILNSLSEFQAAADILVAILPRALECEMCCLNALLYSFTVDAYMGLAGQAAGARLKRTEKLTRCLDYVNRAFDEYSTIEDVLGQCEMMGKKAMIMKIIGDDVLADDYASAYLDLKRGAAMA